VRYDDLTRRLRARSNHPESDLAEAAAAIEDLEARCRHLESDRNRAISHLLEWLTAAQKEMGE
jgi:hypothetical protein